PGADPSDSCGRCPQCIQHQTLNHVDPHYSFPVIKKKSGNNPVSDDFIQQWREFLNENEMMDFERWCAKLAGTGTSTAGVAPMFYVSESDALASKLATTSRSTRYKITLMWLPEKMNEACANKMLKLLEEPQPETIFIITSDNATEILPTIYSRCQPIEVKRLDNYSVARWLVDNRNVSPDEAEKVADISSGSINEAIRQLNVAASGDEFLDLFISLMRLAYQRKIIELRLWAQDVSALPRDRQIAFLNYCCRLLRENFIYNFNMPDLVGMNQNERNFSKNFARFINERNVLKLKRVFEDAVTDITGNGNGRIIFFDVAVRVILLLKQ
ncbi:MAG: DNA polymerase III subunit delta, partial [Muribaculaceae bacterium]|nr:DNA polymerase III subunit delta [Muribaculaceae bacterium]